MKKILLLLFALCALHANAAFLGGIPITNSMHATTNYLPIVAGSHAGQLEWLMAPSNLVAVQNTVILPRTNLADAYMQTNLFLSLGTAAKPAIGFAAEDDGSGLGFFRSASAAMGFAGGTGSELMRFDTSLTVGVGGRFRIGATAAAPDVEIGREAAAILQLGVDAASPVNQTLKSNDGSGTDGVGGSFTNAAGRSTGTGRGGGLVYQTSLSSNASGTAANLLSTRGRIEAKAVTLTESTATTIANITVGTNRYLGIRIMATTHADDATDYQAVTETLAVAVVNKGGVMTLTVSASTPTATAQSSGTLATTWTAVANADGKSVDLKNSAVSSLAQTTLGCKWRVETDSDDIAVVTPQ